MTHETIIKREDGSRLQIYVTVHLDTIKGAVYEVLLYRCEKGKRTFVNVIDSDNYTWRKMSVEDKAIHKQETFAKYLSLEEIQTAKEELWQKLKP